MKRSMCSANFNVAGEGSGAASNVLGYAVLGDAYSNAAGTSKTFQAETDFSIKTNLLSIPQHLVVGCSIPSPAVREASAR